LNTKVTIIKKRVANNALISKSYVTSSTWLVILYFVNFFYYICAYRLCRFSLFFVTRCFFYHLPILFCYLASRNLCYFSLDCITFFNSSAILYCYLASHKLCYFSLDCITAFYSSSILFCYLDSRKFVASPYYSFFYWFFVFLTFSTIKLH
jgi:hypothetical protein